MRRAPIAPLPTNPALALDALSRVIGFVIPLLETPLVRVEAGLTVASAASPGTAVVSSQSTIDWNDTGADEFRVVGYARDATSAGIVLRYVVNGEILASVTAPQGAAASFAGAWQRITPAQRVIIAGDQVGQLTVVGGGANAVLTSVVLQARTVSRVV